MVFVVARAYLIAAQHWHTSTPSSCKTAKVVVYFVERPKKHKLDHPNEPVRQILTLPKVRFGSRAEAGFAAAIPIATDRECRERARSRHMRHRSMLLISERFGRRFRPLADLNNTVQRCSAAFGKPPLVK